MAAILKPEPRSDNLLTSSLFGMRLSRIYTVIIVLYCACQVINSVVSKKARKYFL